jgi:hypothetical protein
MKKALLILVLFFACKNTTAIAQGVPDTLQYLKTIVQNKSQYIGQPFSKLLADLKIGIIYFNYNIRPVPYDRSKERSSAFSFYFPARNEDFNLAYPFLEIIWKEPLNALRSGSIYDQSGGRFSSEARLFYLSGIIEDIKILE